MADRSPPAEVPIQINVRPPAFERRYSASETDDANHLVALVADESYFVRRQALQNPDTPPWVLDLLVRAGATPDLRGKGQSDPDLDPDSLHRLAETGPWARQLVAEHPNTSAAVLAALKGLPSIPLRLAIASHPNADEDTLTTLCCDTEEAIRARALANPNVPATLTGFLMAAGATSDLQGVVRQFGEVPGRHLTVLADLGGWGRFLAARHPDCPTDLLATIADDPDWRVRSGVLDNPNAPNEMIEALLEASTVDDLKVIRCLSQPQIPQDRLTHLAGNPSPEVRLALARHPAAACHILWLLATDGVKEIRRSAARHPQSRAADVARLVRAGSTPNLMGLSEPDPTLSDEEIEALLDGGIWARQLAVRCPTSNAHVLARLLCDGEPKIREWAAVHPNLPLEIRRDLIRAGSGTDFQGIMPPDPDLPAGRLWEIRALGPWGEWVVANNPYAPIELLAELAESNDWQVRRFVAKNPTTPPTTLDRLGRDSVEAVRVAALNRQR